MEVPFSAMSADVQISPQDMQGRSPSPLSAHNHGVCFSPQSEYPLTLGGNTGWKGERYLLKQQLRQARRAAHSKAALLKMQSEEQSALRMQLHQVMRDDRQATTSPSSVVAGKIKRRCESARIRESVSQPRDSRCSMEASAKERASHSQLTQENERLQKEMKALRRELDTEKRARRKADALNIELRARVEVAERAAVTLATEPEDGPIADLVTTEAVEQALDVSRRKSVHHSFEPGALGDRPRKSMRASISAYATSAALYASEEKTRSTKELSRSELMDAVEDLRTERGKLVHELSLAKKRATENGKELADLRKTAAADKEVIVNLRRIVQPTWETGLRQSVEEASAELHRAAAEEDAKERQLVRLLASRLDEQGEILKDLGAQFGCTLSQSHSNACTSVSPKGCRKPEGVSEEARPQADYWHKHPTSSRSRGYVRTCSSPRLHFNQKSDWYAASVSPRVRAASVHALLDGGRVMPGEEMHYHRSLSLPDLHGGTA